MEKNVRIRARITGRVQGVFFRMETQKMANARGVFGWVKNLPDGRVEAVIEGAEQDVNAAIEWCRKGPPMSRVDQVALEEESYTGKYSSFDVAY